MPLDSGVSPLPHFSHASIDLQIWMPLSLTIFVFTTLLPLASIICASDHPRRLFLTCPRWRGLLVFGDEYSIITSGESSLAVFSPKRGALSMSLSSESHALEAMVMFRNPFTTLKSATASQLRARYSPMSWAVSSGFLWDILRRGNTTSVTFPSKLLFVFCRAACSAVTSAPYSSLTAFTIELLICDSTFMINNGLKG